MVPQSTAAATAADFVPHDFATNISTQDVHPDFTQDVDAFGFAMGATAATCNFCSWSLPSQWCRRDRQWVSGIVDRSRAVFYVCLACLGSPCRCCFAQANESRLSGGEGLRTERHAGKQAANRGRAPVSVGSLPVAPINERQSARRPRANEESRPDRAVRRVAVGITRCRRSHRRAGEQAPGRRGASSMRRGRCSKSSNPVLCLSLIRLTAGSLNSIVSACFAIAFLTLQERRQFHATIGGQDFGKSSPGFSVGNSYSWAWQKAALRLLIGQIQILNNRGMNIALGNVLHDTRSSGCHSVGWRAKPYAWCCSIGRIGLTGLGDPGSCRVFTATTSNGSDRKPCLVGGLP